MIKRNAGQLAAVLAEPILADAGIIPPEPGFLEGLRTICTDNDVLLIFDEIITGFRVSLGGAQERYGVLPDITCLAKALGGGTPGAAAFGASREIMALEADNVVLHGGTYSANPLVLAGVNAALDNQVGPMWQVFFGQDEPVTRYRQARASDQRFFGQFQAECQERGVYFHNFNFERFFASTKATIQHAGNRAFYSPDRDIVQMPELNTFRDAESYYATLAHEMTHWTRHSSRLDRDLGRKRFADAGYAMEELVALSGQSAPP